MVVLLAWLLLPLHGHAALTEEVIKLPVKVRDLYGKPVERDVTVTIFRDDTARKPLPLVIINHGRAVSAEDRLKLGRVKYSAISRWFVQQGFMVALPTRIGYGETGGDDVEDSGSCQRKQYGPAYEAAAQQSQAVIDALRQRPEVDSSRVLVVGQSFGGMVSVALAAKNVTGLKGAVNFAGGGGGNPQTHSQQPCGTAQLEGLFKEYGKTSKIPTLWIYTENDQWMGPRFPKQWFDAFQQAGGQGEFVLFPPLGEDGHGLFSKAPEVWQPKMKTFIERIFPGK